MKMDQRLSKFPRKPIYTTPRSPLIHKENHSDPILPSLQLTFYHPLTCVATPQVKAEVTQRKSLSECGLTLPAPSALAHIMLSVTGFTCPYFCRHVSLSIISTATCSVVRVAMFSVKEYLYDGNGTTGDPVDPQSSPAEEPLPAPSGSRGR